jgi:hypothetical protein
MAEIVIVQSIKSVWTKQSRGGRLAVARNMVAEALAVPLRGLSADERFIFHSIVYDESNHFAAPVINSVGVVESLRLLTGCVQIERVDGRVLARYEYDTRCGAPSRAKRPGAHVGQSFELLPGEHGRIVYNGRFSDDEWRYEKRVLNVGRFAQPIERAFLQAQPKRLIDDTASLW